VTDALKIAKIAVCACACAALLAVAYAELERGKAEVAIKGEVHSVAAVVKTDLHDTMVKAQSSLAAADTLTGKSGELVDSQADALQRTTLQTGLLVKHTDASLNCTGIGIFGIGTGRYECTQIGLLVRLNSIAGKVDGKTDAYLEALDKVLTNLKSASGHADTILGGDSIPRILKALAESSEHSDGATIHFEQMTIQGQAGLTDLATLIHAIVDPAPVAKKVQALRVLLQLLGISAKVGQARTAVGQ
jgi:hypothetical protein